MSASRDRLLDFLYREARLLDDRQWDEWLECYSPKVEYWMPAWDDHDTLTEDPQSEISLIYYPSRDGLEDRVFRIKTERSSASTPEPRTAPWPVAAWRAPAPACAGACSHGVTGRPGVQTRYTTNAR